MFEGGRTMKNPFLIGKAIYLRPQEHYRDGCYWNTIMMGILREEWTARRGL
jgi:hypothetical protein